MKHRGFNQDVKPKKGSFERANNSSHEQTFETFRNQSVQVVFDQL